MKLFIVLLLLISFQTPATPLEELHLHHIYAREMSAIQNSGLSPYRKQQRLSELKDERDSELAAIKVRDFYIKKAKEGREK